jgi:class 3 adenylate cyclase
MSSSELQQLELTIQGLESQRAILGDAVADAALGPLRSRLATLRAGAAAQHRAQALKHVSILFMDVVGSTALVQHLDAEEVSAVMDGALSRGTAIVEAHRGKVLQYAGDCILAPSARTAQRACQRAVRCGVALLKLGRRSARKCDQRTAMPASTFASASTAATSCSAAAASTTARSAASP